MKKGLLSILAAAAVLVSCQNYDDQFDNLNTQITALKTQVDGLAGVQSTITQLQGQLNSLQDAALTSADLDAALSDGLADIAADVDAIDTSVVETSEDLDAINEQLTDQQEDLEELLANSSVFTGPVVVNSVATLDAFHQMKGSLSIVNGDVTITVSEEMDQAKVQELVDAMLTIIGDLKYTSNSSSIAETTFNNLTGVTSITATQAGGYQFQALTSASNIRLYDNYESTVTVIDFRALTTVDNFFTDTTEDIIEFNKATELHLTSLGRYSTTSANPLKLIVDEGAALPLAIDDVATDGDQEDLYLEITGPDAITFDNIEDGKLSFTDVKAVTVNGFLGTIVTNAGVESLSADTVVDTPTLGSDLESISLTGAADADVSGDTHGPSIIINDQDNVETITLAGKLGPITIDGADNLTDLTISADVNGAISIGATTNNSDLVNVTLTGSKATGVTVSNNAEIEALTIDTTIQKSTAAGAKLDGSVIVENNNALTTLTISSSNLETLTIKGNDDLTTIDGTGIVALGATAKPTVTIEDNDLTASASVDAEDTTATADGASSSDLGSISTDSGMDTLKTYLALVAADADSTAEVYFDTVESYTNESDTEVTDQVWVDGNVPTANKVLVLTPNTADTGDAATTAKRSFVITKQTSFEAYANNADLVGTAVTLDANNSVAISTQILTSAATTAATAAGVTMTAVDGGNPVGYVAIGPNSSAAENSATGAVKASFATTVSDTMTITVEGRSLTYTGVAHTGTVAYANAIVASWAAKYTTAATERYTITTADGTSALAGTSFVLIKFTAKDRGTGSLNKAVAATFSAGKNQTDSNVGIMIGNDASFTKSTADNVTKGDDIVLTFEASTSGSILSEIGYFGKTQADAAKNISLVAGTYAELSSTYFANNESASNVSRANINVYPAESRRNDVVMPEELNAAAASNAVSFTRVHWL